MKSLIIPTKNLIIFKYFEKTSIRPTKLLRQKLRTQLTGEAQGDTGDSQ